MIKATLKRSWKLCDATNVSDPRKCIEKVPTGPGEFELERIPNPLGFNGYWLVLKGTRIGWSEGAWRQWQNGVLNTKGEPIDWGEFEIIIQED